MICFQPMQIRFFCNISERLRFKNNKYPTNIPSGRFNDKMHFPGFCTTSLCNHTFSGETSGCRKTHCTLPPGCHSGVKSAFRLCICRDKLSRELIRGGQKEIVSFIVLLSTKSTQKIHYSPLRCQGNPEHVEYLKTAKATFVRCSGGGEEWKNQLGNERNTQRKHYVQLKFSFLFLTSFLFWLFLYQ